ncbi:MAG: hypothetical protein ACKOX6_14070 [Bdellovibrio sp.]
MAKIVKKKAAAKPAAKAAKKAPAKAASKPAPKKVAPKTVVKKKADKAPAKPVAKKPEIKKKVEAKVEPKGKVAAKPVKDVKETKAEVAKKVEKKAAPAPAPVEKAVASKKAEKAPKKGKGAKKEKDKEESDIDDDFIADDDMMGDEIGEYEEELKAVEESEEEVDVVEEWTPEEKDKGDEEIVLTDAEGRRYCRARDCDQIAAVDVYCRYHYLLFWRKIQVRKKILVDGKLERYVEELTARYPDKFLEMIRRDLRTEKDFLAAIQELEIDESATENEFEEDNSAFIEEVRGMGDSGGGTSDDDEY